MTNIEQEEIAKLKNTISPVKIVEIGPTKYIPFSKQMQEYVGYVEGKEILIMKFDTSKKYGNYIGFGTKKD